MHMLCEARRVPPAAACPRPAACRCPAATAPTLLFPTHQGVCPGDVVMGLPDAGVVRIGGGVQQDGEQLIAVKTGVLQQAHNAKLWVEARQKR